MPKKLNIPPIDQPLSTRELRRFPYFAIGLGLGLLVVGALRLAGVL